MAQRTLNHYLRRLIQPGSLTFTARSVEIFGWIDLALGLLIFIAPVFAAALFHLPPLSTLAVSLLHLVGVLVVALGLLYIINGRFNSLGFAVASLLDRPLVPLIMAVLWYRQILPGPLALAFSVTDFGGFLATVFAWRADLRHGRNIGGPGISSQTRAAHFVERFGWLLVAVGLVTLLCPRFTASLLQINGFWEGLNYLQLVGLLSGGLGMLFLVGSSLDLDGTFVFASVSVQGIVILLGTLLWRTAAIPNGLALAVVGISLGGAATTVWAACAGHRTGSETQDVPLIAQGVSGFFAFLSGVVRNSRVFHPDGRTFLGTVHRFPPGAGPTGDAEFPLAGMVLMRIGMGVMKRGMPQWLAKRIPDAPSVASRFFARPDVDSVTGTQLGNIPVGRRPEKDLDLLATAGGDRLWKLLWNLSTGGKQYGLEPYDYFANVYYADVPYRIASLGGRFWIRLKEPKVAAETSTGLEQQNPQSREQALTAACAAHAVLHLEIQPVDDPTASFQPYAVLRFEQEIDIDQESLHFEPFAGRGFEPYGFFTGLRRSVYPASAQSRPNDSQQRQRREHHPWQRLVSYWSEAPALPTEGESIPMVQPSPAENAPLAKRRWVRVAWLAAFLIVVASGLYLVERFTRNIPVDYPDEATFFERGSTGGERMNGIPYWVWVTLPEIFPEKLPDHKTGQGYAAFGLIYEPRDKNNPYALPLGMSQRNFSGLDVVYLNCGACHIGTVRDSPNAEPHSYPGMPAHQFNLGAWGTFLTSIPKDQKFTPQRILDQIDAMQDDPRRLVPKPDFIDRLILKYYAIPLMRDKLIILGQRLSFIDNSTWGPGRVDTFNAPKALLNFPMDLADKDEKIGNADFPSVWYQQARKGMHLHWDGNNTSVDERNLSAAFGTGAYPPILDVDRVKRMARYLETAAPPPYPVLPDKVLTAKGEPIYKKYCFSCHGAPKPPFRATPPVEGETCDYEAAGAECVGTVVPIKEIGTDPSRFNSYTWLLAVNQSTLYAGYEKDWGFQPDYPHRFHQFRKTHGYASMPLDGIWLRGPYLHNGSVPTLNDLLKAPSERPAKFYSGNDVIDRENIGFVSNVAEQNGRKYFCFDTSKDGNSNKGHEYGTQLKPDEKRALLEYLKTF